MKQVIKYAALIFALVLATTIIGGCLTAGISVVKMIVEKGGDSLTNEDGKGIWYRTEEGDVVFMGIRFGGRGDVISGSEQFEKTEITALDIEGTSNELVIETWDEDFISVVYENIAEDYEIFNESGTLTIQYEDNLFVWGTPTTEKSIITIQIPADLSLKKTLVENGSGRTTIFGLHTEIFRVESGSGAVTISGVEAEETKLDTGSGSVKVQDSYLGEAALDTGSGSANFEVVESKNLVVDSGSGRIEYKGILSGNCIFDTGSGSVNLDILGRKEEYNIKADLGNGGLYINGAKEKDMDIQYNGAANLLIFDTGSGRVSINFQGAGAYSRDR